MPSGRSRAARSAACFPVAAYQAKTTDFWHACDGISGSSYWQQFGAPSDGKGEPEQINAISHGCFPSRFRQINVLLTD